jgi:flagellar biosynthesis protein FlhB
VRRKILLAISASVVAFILFFFLVPVIGFHAPVCISNSLPNYESLSFRLSNVGEVYYAGRFFWMAHGFVRCI